LVIGECRLLIPRRLLISESVDNQQSPFSNDSTIKDHQSRIESARMSWWIWVTLGLVLVAIELATPGGIFIIFFGIAALVVGALSLAGLVTTTWVQWLLFPVMAVVALRLFRQPLLGRLRLRDKADAVDSLVGEVATPSSDIAAGGHGRAELRGSSWNVRNVADVPIAAGQRCRVVTVQGLLLDIRPE
jgi:membrane protein implicated in regulation of membrane protease activity